MTMQELSQSAVEIAFNTLFPGMDKHSLHELGHIAVATLAAALIPYMSDDPNKNTQEPNQ